MQPRLPQGWLQMPGAESLPLFPLMRAQVQTSICFSLMVGHKTEVWPDVEADAGNPLEGKARKPQFQSQPRVQ